MKKEILVIVPAYNEEGSISGVIREIKESLPESEILVVDDGSSDKTAELAKKEADFCITLPFHLGLGSALQTGYIFAQEKGYEFVVHFDADGQHIGKEIKKIIEPVLKNECDFALGSRFLNNHRPKTPVLRILGSRFISKILSFLISQSISDPTSGFRAMNEKTFSLFTKYYPHDYPEVEELLFLAKNGFRIKEIPINMRPRIKGKSSLTLGKTFFYMFKVILVLLLDSLWLIKFKNKRSIILK